MGEAHNGNGSDFGADVVDIEARRAYAVTRDLALDFEDFEELDQAVARQLPSSFDPELRREIVRTVHANSPCARIQELAELDALDYERERVDAAKQLGWRVGVLDAAVSKHRRDAVPASAALFEDLEPWPGAVDGAELLEKIVRLIERFVRLPVHAAATIALWTIFAHAHDAFSISTVLGFSSPQKRCGKSTGLGIVRRLVPRPVVAANITAAALFRIVELHLPTLLIDEADTFLKENDELRGVLNSGHARATAQVVRTVGDDHIPRAFGTWAPKVIALIGELPDTLEDRAIEIRMTRRKPGEPVERTRADRDHGFGDLARQAARWAADHLEVLRDADPQVPEKLHDRAADNWRPLLAIADLAGGEWPARARGAALALSGARDDESIGPLLLVDIRSTFAERRTDRLGSKVLAEALGELADRPWSDWKAGRPLSASALARLLRPFGVRSKQMRLADGSSLKGYAAVDFTDAWERYIPTPSTPPGNETSKQANHGADLGANQNETREPDVSLCSGGNPRVSQGCFDVSFQKGVEGGPGGRVSRGGPSDEDRVANSEGAPDFEEGLL